jgi:hypothetical protein
MFMVFSTHPLQLALIALTLLLQNMKKKTRGSRKDFTRRIPAEKKSRLALHL